MNSKPPSTASCRECRFYGPSGRRGGNCSKLGVAVGGTWASCSLAVPPFAPSLETADFGTDLRSAGRSLRDFDPCKSLESNTIVALPRRSGLSPLDLGAIAPASSQDQTTSYYSRSPASPSKFSESLEECLPINA